MHGLQSMKAVNNHNVLFALSYSIGERVMIEQTVEGQHSSIHTDVSHNDPRSGTLQAGGFEFRKSDGQCTSGANVTIKAVGRYARASDREVLDHSNHDTEGQFAVA